MHSLLDGVLKKLMMYWFDSSYSSKSFSLRKFMQEIDKRLLIIKPPKFVRTPRTIYNHSLWHAHEYLAFILYYSLPVFETDSIDKQKLEISDKIINEFVCEQESLYYGKESMLSGSHELLHLSNETLDFGPLNYINCFQFKELNLYLNIF